MTIRAYVVGWGVRILTVVREDVSSWEDLVEAIAWWHRFLAHLLPTHAEAPPLLVSLMHLPSVVSEFLITWNECPGSGAANRPASRTKPTDSYLTPFRFRSTLGSRCLTGSNSSRMILPALRRQSGGL